MPVLILAVPMHQSLLKLLKFLKNYGFFLVSLLDAVIGMFTRRFLYTDANEEPERFTWKWWLELIIELVLRVAIACVCASYITPWVAKFSPYLAGAISGLLQGMITICWDAGRKVVKKVVETVKEVGETVKNAVCSVWNKVTSWFW
jgi:hypothetical protein